ncbi:MAG TPA: hypothetical protein VFI81_06185 [Rhodanobacteraceae bacterium]|nr:hypothetical protein [Rhodanobacteraceae bacterium]
MKRILTLATVLLIVATVAACSRGGGHDRSTSIFQHLSIADNGDVVAHARDGSDARITAAGDLDIQGKSLAVTPAQRELLKGYHADAVVLRKDAVATGEAGMKTGMHALDAVAKGLASGNADSIDREVDSRAKQVDALANAVCQDLARLYADQGKVAAAMPAFGPYATIEPHEVSECRGD